MSGARRIAVLGGGAAGLTAAWELTATPELSARHEVTVYQPGWRLGGKCASGRNRATGERIEEHGLHVWFGFYENAFNLIQRCYAELGRAPDAPLATWEAAFEACNDVVLASLDEDGCRWRTWHFPPNDGVPGQPGDESLGALTQRALEWMRDGGMTSTREVLPVEHDAALDALRELASTGAAGAGASAPPAHHGLLDRAFDAVRDAVRDLGHEEQAVHEQLREYASAIDLAMAVARGIVADGLLERGFGSVNGEELSEWLARHGAGERTVAESSPLRAFYQLCFAYDGGHRDRPSVAAGKGLQALIRIVLTYQGAVIWEMQAGMGDAIFAPLYEVLRRRGVRFEFFHHVARLGVSADGRTVEEVEVIPQVEVSGGVYEPLVEIRGLPCWPSEPRWEQLIDGDGLRAARVDFEREANPLGAAARTMRRGSDFDDVVLAIPVGALPALCGELAARSPRFAEMLGAARTVATQALQVWLRADASQLGLSGTDAIAGAYAPPLDTYSDMSHLLPREGWGDRDQVRHIGYFCGVMADDVAPSQAAAQERARADGLAHLRDNGSSLWPGAARDGSGEFDFALLVDRDGREGEARYEAQYWRANAEGANRYVLTPPGSVERRLRPDESGYENLVLAGDWTRNGICGGSVEAAVTSGRMAARALCGEPAEVPGLAGWLKED